MKSSLCTFFNKPCSLLSKSVETADRSNISLLYLISVVWPQPKIWKTALSITLSRAAIIDLRCWRTSIEYRITGVYKDLSHCTLITSDPVGLCDALCVCALLDFVSWQWGQEWTFSAYLTLWTTFQTWSSEWKQLAKQASHIPLVLQRAQCSHCKRCISYGNSVCPSVCLSVRLSHAGIVSKRRHVARCTIG